MEVGQAQMAHIMRRGLKDIFGFAALKLIECIGLSSKAELRPLTANAFLPQRGRGRERRREWEPARATYTQIQTAFN